MKALNHDEPNLTHTHTDTLSLVNPEVQSVTHSELTQQTIRHKELLVVRGVNVIFVALEFGNI